MHPPPPDKSGVSHTPLRVSEFIRQIRFQLEGNFPLGWVSGEVSGLTRAGSGHLYFTLKDGEGQLRCTMWRNRAQLLPFQLREGMQVEVRAQLTVYEARGDLQLSVEHIRETGLGNLYEAFMRLKTRLASEGLFASTLKRPLPRLPRGLAIISSPDAAALQDVLACLARRAPGLPCVLYPTRVQGDGAGAQIAAAIERASVRRAEDGCEVMIVCRGGGSLEDLWAFNEEAVVRAIRASQLPVVCGVGHESDTTLADYAADARAATPSAAAELVSTGLLALREQLPDLRDALASCLSHAIARCGQRLDLAEHRLIHPRERLHHLQERLAQLHARLALGMHSRLRQGQQDHQTLHARLQRAQPDTRLHAQRTHNAGASMTKALQGGLQDRHRRLDRLATALEHLNPGAVLQRGYALVRNEAGQLVRHADTLATGERLDIQLATGHIEASVIAHREER